MSLELDPSDDFGDCIDGVETVTLRRRASDETVAIPTAYRLESKAEEAVPSGGTVEQNDAVWHVQLPHEAMAPCIGDVLIDAYGSCWTILQAEELPRLQRWQCTARHLSVAYGYLDRVVVERPVFADLGSGPVVVEWNYVFTALPVRIQPLEVDVKVTEDAGTTPQSYFEIIFGEPVALEPYDRFLAEDGTIYTMDSYEGAERIDALPVVRVLRQEGS